jgi:endogenous inhibitor of DNA gyrase (YacG/DUF329 family)
MSQTTCPICERICADKDDNPNFPFCSKRCKLLDLSRWLDGDYRVPVGVEQSERSGPGQLDLAVARAEAAMPEDELPS